MLGKDFSNRASYTSCVFMLQIILGTTRYNSVQLSFIGFQKRLKRSCTELYQVITRYNSVLLGSNTELNGVVLSCTELYLVIVVPSYIQNDLEA